MPSYSSRNDLLYIATLSAKLADSDMELSLEDVKVISMFSTLLSDLCNSIPESDEEITELFTSYIDEEQN